MGFTSFSEAVVSLFRTTRLRISEYEHFLSTTLRDPGIRQMLA